MRRKTTEEFIAEARAVHGEKYDYTKTVYIDTKTKVIITCPEHGDFEQSPGHHLRGCGCSKCSGKYKPTTAEFIERAREIHGDKYDYSKVVYVDANTKVIITCPEHGDFEQTPCNHLYGYGCSQCGSLSMTNSKRFTTDDFICKARETHGDKYNYSKVNYTGTTTKVIIICPDHGEFEQRPCDHLRGRGCPKCGVLLRANANKCKMTTADFLLRAKEIHGDKYDYSKVEYVNAHTKVIITCPDHGDFEQTPDSHLQGRGCPQCGGSVKLTTENFIKRATEIHGGKYEYSKVVYTNAHTKVTITCPVHGDFEQRPYIHLQGQGCPQCAYLFKAVKRRLSTEDFISKARKIHGGKYTYSNVAYTDMNTKVVITCPVHGNFEQNPALHLQGYGCPLCGGTVKLTSEDFINRAKEIHSNKYDYSKVKYINAHTKVIITCPEHGDFEQAPQPHLRGNGCPICRSSHLARIVQTALDGAAIDYECEKTFDWLRFDRKMRLDYFLPDYNIGIECQGEQHFDPVSAFGGLSTFEQGFKRDIMKRELCAKNGVKLLYFALPDDVPEWWEFYKVYTDVDELLAAIKEIGENKG